MQVVNKKPRADTKQDNEETVDTAVAEDGKVGDEDDVDIKI